MQGDRETTRFSRQQVVISLLALIVAIVAIVVGLLNPEIRQWLGLGQSTNLEPSPTTTAKNPVPTRTPVPSNTWTPPATPKPLPTRTTTAALTPTAPPTARPSTPVSQEPPTVVPTKCLSMHLGAGKQFIVTIYNGCYYHFNIACAGCKVGEENNYVIYYAGSTTKVTVPDGSVWQYSREPNQGEVCSDNVDHWPSNLPSFLNLTGVQQLLPCGGR
jgi:hypothetical protein